MWKDAIRLDFVRLPSPLVLGGQIGEIREEGTSTASDRPFVQRRDVVRVADGDAGLVPLGHVFVSVHAVGDADFKPEVPLLIAEARVVPVRLEDVEIEVHRLQLPSAFGEPPSVGFLLEEGRVHYRRKGGRCGVEAHSPIPSRDIVDVVHLSIPRALITPRTDVRVMEVLLADGLD